MPAKRAPYDESVLHHLAMERLQQTAFDGCDNNILRCKAGVTGRVRCVFCINILHHLRDCPLRRDFHEVKVQ